MKITRIVFSNSVIKLFLGVKGLKPLKKDQERSHDTKLHDTCIITRFKKKYDKTKKDKQGQYQPKHNPKEYR